MDYETKATSRKELRLYARLFRIICGFTPNEPINPIKLLDVLPNLEGFDDVQYEIVYNDVLPGTVPAQCIKTEELANGESPLSKSKSFLPTTSCW